MLLHVDVACPSKIVVCSTINAVTTTAAFAAHCCGNLHCRIGKMLAICVLHGFWWKECDVGGCLELNTMTHFTLTRG